MLPIYTYGQPVLRKVAQDIEKDYPALNELIDRMFETMYQADGVGLAAPQIGKSIRLFVIDATTVDEDDPDLKDFKKVFVNAEIVERSGEDWLVEEGCLSVPSIREEVKRKTIIQIQYYDENFNYHEEYYDGVRARIIQHEYDHLDGTLFVDKLSPLKKRLIKSKLNNIVNGKIDVNYKVKFANKK